MESSNMRIKLETTTDWKRNSLCDLFTPMPDRT